MKTLWYTIGVLTLLFIFPFFYPMEFIPPWLSGIMIGGLLITVLVMYLGGAKEPARQLLSLEEDPVRLYANGKYGVVECDDQTTLIALSDAVVQKQSTEITCHIGSDRILVRYKNMNLIATILSRHDFRMRLERARKRNGEIIPVGILLAISFLISIYVSVEGYHPFLIILLSGFIVVTAWRETKKEIEALTDLGKRIGYL